MVPYLLVTCAVSLLFGSLPVGYGWYSPGVALVLSAVVFLLVLLTFGERLGDDASPGVSQSPAVAPSSQRPLYGWKARFFFGRDIGAVVFVPCVRGLRRCWGATPCGRKSRRSSSTKRSSADGDALRQSLLGDSTFS